MANNILDNAIMAQSLLERLKSSVATESESIKKEIKKELAVALSNYEGVVNSKAKTNNIIKSLSVAVAPVLNKHTDALSQQVISALIDLHDIEYHSFKSVFSGVKVNKSNIDDLERALNNKPLSLKNWNGELYIGNFILAWSVLAKNQIKNTVIQKFALSEQVSSISGILYSDKRLGYNVVDKIAKDYDSVARTALQHAQSVAASQFYSVNPDLVQLEEFAAILDSRTSATCRALDATTYPVGKGPRPPLHFRCRSRMLPVINDKYKAQLKDANLNESVYGGESYYEWLSRQSVKRQNLVLGSARAELFRNGGLSAKEFARLQLDRNFKPLSLEAMRRIIPDAFEKAKL